MTKHFAAVFIAASTLLAATSHGALARTRHHVVRASHTVRMSHGGRSSHVVREAAVQAIEPGDRSNWAGETGKASYYSAAYNGRRAASGVRFDQMELTAAHSWLPFGTKVRVLLAGSDRSVIVTITDRMYSARHVVDLSLAAARQLGIVRQGVAQVSLQPV